MTAVEMIKTALQNVRQGQFKAAWEVLDRVPDCPQCKGSGLPNTNGFTEVVYWQGQLVEVCATCEGRGRVV